MTSSLRDRYQRELALRGYAPDAAQSAAIEQLQALSERVRAAPARGVVERLLQRLHPANDAQREMRGIYLWGGVGRGKTWLMDLFFTTLPRSMRRRSHFHHFMREVHAQLRQLGAHRDPLELVARDMARRIRVLCLDELFVSDIADAMLLAGLFDALLRAGVLLVITSNVPPNELYRDGLQRSRFLPAIALLERELQIIAMDGGVDYRLRHLQRQPIYLDAHAPETPSRLQQLFEEVATDEADSNTHLTICGRALRARRRSGDVVWFDFPTLCEGPRSQEDYVEIAREFRTVLLSDVPVFATAQQDNAARRFIALLDEFYDQGVKLLISAAAPPDALYRGERLQFEFRRTASRLVEMQTTDYLARPHRA